MLVLIVGIKLLGNRPNSLYMDPHTFEMDIYMLSKNSHALDIHRSSYIRNGHLTVK